ncbi:Uncharacterised protein [Legionella geestiana]|nr:Uncharacterised protein [Legionella geestiana]
MAFVTLKITELVLGCSVVNGECPRNWERPVKFGQIDVVCSRVTNCQQTLKEIVIISIVEVNKHEY